MRQTNRRLRSSSRCSSSVRRSSAESAIAVRLRAAGGAGEPAVTGPSGDSAHVGASRRPRRAPPGGGRRPDVGERRLRRDRRRLRASSSAPLPAGDGARRRLSRRRRLRRRAPPRAAALRRSPRPALSMADLRSTLDLRSPNVPVTLLEGLARGVDLTSLIWSIDLAQAELRSCAVSAALRNSRTPLPSDLPICGSRLGPKTSRARMRTMTISAGPMLMRGSPRSGVFVPFHRTVAAARSQRGPPSACRTRPVARGGGRA